MYLYTRTRLSMYSTTGLKSYTFWNFNRNQTQNDRIWQKGKFYFLKMCGFFAFVSSLKNAPIKCYRQAFFYTHIDFLQKKDFEVILAHFKQ